MVEKEVKEGVKREEKGRRRNIGNGEGEKERESKGGGWMVER